MDEKGICPVCGKSQPIKNGKMSQHDYEFKLAGKKVNLGKCKGVGSLPR